MKQVQIITEQTIDQNDRFWAASGLDELYAFAKTEAGAFLMNRMKEKGTCRYVRNHFTLNHEIINGIRCGGDVYSEDADGNPVYDFVWINDVFRRFLEYGIKPIVELDYMPDELTSSSGGVIQEGTDVSKRNRHCPNNWEKWDALLRAFVKNLVNTFGSDEVRTWYFEVWNEPDSWDVSSWPSFFRLYDVFAEAVKSVDSKLRVGGPACFRMPLFQAFLNHIANETNYVTGKKGIPLDFISYHIYGMSGGWLNDYPLVMPSVQRFTQELLWVKRAIDTYPSLRNTEFMLNEWGVVSNYERTCAEYPPLEIRNSEYSALFAVKLVDCIYTLRRKHQFPLSIMLYWGFSGEDFHNKMFNGNRSLTTGNHICKPIQTAHEFLAMLGNEILATDGLNPGSDDGLLATRSGDCIQTLIYYFNEYDAERNMPSRSYSLSFHGLEDGVYRLKIYTMDATHNNTYRLWQRLGTPKDLSEDELEKLYAEQEITSDTDIELTVKDGLVTYDVELSSISMKLLTLEPVNTTLA